MDTNDIAAIIAENRRRRQRLITPYDPIHGIGCCGPRVHVDPTPYNDGPAMIPQAMIDDPEYRHVNSHTAWVQLRCRHDFEYWAATCVTITDKNSKADVKMTLNAPQRRVAAMLEDDRRANLPLRLIMLKARQWGGSTLVQMYMAWIQTCLRRNWHSLICAHVKDTAATIRGMYTRMLDSYPDEYWTGDAPTGFRPFERSINTRIIDGRGCRVTLGSSENHDAVRGADYAMAHLSEVAFWHDSPRTDPVQFIRAICGAINSAPLTLIALESTANGVGNYFHREWIRAVTGRSDKRPVFVPWHEIEIYRNEVPDEEAAALVAALDEYEQSMWDQGLSLDQIAWYHAKRREYESLKQMQAEFPGTDIEAFSDVERNVFSPDHVEVMRSEVIQPDDTGELIGNADAGSESLVGIHFVPDPAGRMKMWRRPMPAHHYVVSVDIGGRSQSADWSVIAVMDRNGGDNRAMPEVVAQWRGHVDHDMLAWYSARMARYYNNALLVIESNTLESEFTECGDPAYFILNQVQEYYPNLYRRPTAEGSGSRIGFHTNRATKAAVINRLIAMVREHAYIEHDTGALDELITYQAKPNGAYAAIDGAHDDILMTRAIALHVIATGATSAHIAPSKCTYATRFRW